MRMCPEVRRRCLLVASAAGLLVVSGLRIPPLPAWQAGIPLSRPGQEDLTFWVNHNGLEQLDALGEVGFGDMARILMRRRSNAGLMRELRDRFTFKVREMSAIRNPDAFRAVVTENGLAWARQPAAFVIAASHTFNLPLLVENQTGAALRVRAEFQGTTAKSDFADAELAPRATGGYFLRVVESEPGPRKGRLLVQTAGRELAGEIAFDVRPLVHLSVKLVEPGGRPAAARVYLTGSDGLAYAPRGSINRYTAMSAEPYFHAEDSFALDLPAGQTLIEATRGQEYKLASRTVDLVPGSSPSVTIQLQRWADMAAKGWYSSDSHIHANYTSHHHQAIDPYDVRLYAHAEDLNNANLMVANSSGSFLHDFQYFEGRPHSLSDDRFILYWNEEMRNGGPYGHMSFYNLKQLVYPLFTGTPGTPYADDYPANYTQAEAARKQAGAVTYVHPAMAPNFENAGGVSARELPVDLALGQVDALDVVSNVDELAAMELWYRLLNCGFRLAISAGTDSFTNVADHYTPGGGRVYVHSGNPLRYQDWVGAYKQGRSFASNGPVVTLTVDGKEPGEDLQFPEGSRPRVRIKASVMTQVPLDRVEVVVNGKPVISRDAKDKTQIDIDEQVPLEGTSWIAARATGPWHRLVLNDIQTFAHTSPVYVRTGSQRLALAPDARFYEEWIEKLIASVNARGRFQKPEQRKEVIDLFRRAQEVYRQLQRPAGAAGG
jgi:hypothetical protein